MGRNLGYYKLIGDGPFPEAVSIGCFEGSSLIVGLQYEVTVLKGYFGVHAQCVIAPKSGRRALFGCARWELKC